MATKKATAKDAGQITNDAQICEPYIAEVTIVGTAPILFHRYSVEAQEEKSAAAKGSNTKKTDETETYLYRNENNEICIPGEYLRQSIVRAGKYKQDPRNSRQSCMELFKSGLIMLDELSSTGHDDPDYYDKRRVVVQRSAIPRTRPALQSGWTATFRILVQVPEYINPAMLNEMIQNAGRLVGIGDFRPTYGRFQVSSFQVLEG